MNKSRKIISFFLIVIIILGACSCGRNNNNLNTNTYVFGQDSQENYFNNNISNLSEGTNNYYYLNSNNGYIYSIDKKTYDCVPLCNKVNCLHDKEKDNTNCDAHIGNVVLGIACYMNNIYCLTSEEYKDKDGNKGILQKMIEISSNGEIKRTVFEIKDISIWYFKIHRGYIYYTTVRADNSKYAMYRISISDNNNKPDEFIKYYNYGTEDTLYVYNTYFYGNYLFLNIRYFSNKNKASYHMISYNLLANKWKDINKKLKHKVEDFIILNQKIVYVDRGFKSLYECDFHGKNEKELFKLPKSNKKMDLYYYPYTDGENLIIAPGNAAPRNIFLFYTKEYNFIGEFKMPFKFAPDVACNKNVFITSYNDKLYVIEKTKFVAKKIYEFPSN